MVAGRGEVVPYRGPNQNPLWLWPLRPSLRPRTLPSACPSGRPSIRLCTYPSMYPSILAPVHSSVCTFMHPHTHSCFHFSVYPNTHPCAYPSFYLCLHPSTSQCTHHIHTPIPPRTHQLSMLTSIHAPVHASTCHLPIYVFIHPSINAPGRHSSTAYHIRRVCFLLIKLFAASTATSSFRERSPFGNALFPRLPRRHVLLVSLLPFCPLHA